MLVKNPYLSIIIPIFNSNRNLLKVLKNIEEDPNLKKLKYEVILINDGSTKKETLNLLKETNKKKKFKIINLQKNLGQHYASLIGCKHARGKFISTIDDDFEDNPKNIFKMLQYLKKNKFDVVFQKKIKSKELFRNLSSSINQFIIRKTFNLKKNLSTSSFKVFTDKINKKVLLEDFYNPNLSCLILNVTNNIGNYTHNEKRKKSKSRYTLLKLIKLNIILIQDYSNILINSVFTIGILSFIFALAYSSFAIFKSITYGLSVPGWTTIVVLISLFSSIILTFQFVSINLLKRILNKKNIYKLKY